MTHLPFWFLWITALICGACVMVIEVLGSRVVGSFFGVSLFVWTSLITVTMVALAGGYWLGGRMADKWKSAGYLYAAILLAGIFTATIPVLKGPVLKMFVSLGLKTGSFASATLLFGFPLFLLGLVSPYLVRLAALKMEEIGKTVGSLYSISTIGSVIGTVITGFVLIAVLSVSRIFILVGLLLVALSVFYWVFFGRKPIAIAALIIPVMMLLGGSDAQVSYLLDNGTKATLKVTKSGFYGVVKVVDYSYGRVATRELLIDGLIQGGIDLNNRLPIYEYLYFMDFLPTSIRPGGSSCLVLGLGAGIVPDIYASKGISVDSVDINSDVVEVARDYFGFDPGEVHIGDARHFLMGNEKSYDYIVLDVYNGDSMPTHLLTVESFRLMKRRMNSNAVMVMNLHGAVDGSDMVLSSVVRTLEQVFDNVDIYPAYSPDKNADGNIALAVYDGPEQPLGPEAVEGMVVHPVARDVVLNFHKRSYELPEDMPFVLLTDDYNPVDLMGARMHEKVRERVLADTNWDILLAEQ